MQSNTRGQGLVSEADVPRPRLVLGRPPAATEHELGDFKVASENVSLDDNRNGLLSDAVPPAQAAPSPYTQQRVVVALVFLFSFFFGYLVGYVNSKSSTMLASSPSVPPSLALPSSLAAPPPPPYVRAAWLPAYSLDQLAPLQRSVFFDTQTAAPVARLGQVVLDPATGVAWLCMGLSGLGHGPAFDLSNTLIAHRVVFPELNATHLAISASSQGWVSSAGDCRVDKIMTRLSPGTLAHVSVVFDPSLGGCPVGAAYDASTKSVAIALSNGTLAVIADLDGSHRGSADMSAWGVFASPPVVGAGSRVFVSLPSYSGIGVVSLTTAAAVSPPQAWLVKPCAEPGQLAIDAARSRLFVTCGASPSSPSQSVAVLDATPQGAGFRLATLPLGRGSCGLAFDAPSARLFASCAASPVVAVYQTQVGGTEDQYAMMGAFTVGAGSTGYIAVGRDPLGPPGAPPTVVTAAAVGVFDPTAPPAADGGGEWGFPNRYVFGTTRLVISNMTT